MKVGVFSFVFCLIAGWEGSLQAQTWVHQTNVFGPDSIVTTGGITYASYTYVVGDCGTMSSVGPLSRSGSDLSFDFGYEMETGVACPGALSSEAATIVLGVLSPGDYALTTTSWGAPVSATNFIVPNISSPTLQPITLSSNGLFQMQLNGVSNVNYTLQRSTDLVDWTAISTNSIGQALTDTNGLASSRRFYRVQINTVNVGPYIP